MTRWVVRILHVVSRSQRRGAERVALDLAEELDELGHENRVVALALGHDGEEDPALPALVRSVSLGIMTRAVCAWRLGRTIRKAAPDVVLTHGGNAAQVTVAGLPWRRPPVVVWQTIIGFPNKIRRQPRRFMWWLVARKIDGAVSLTDEEAAELRWLGFTGPLSVIANFRRAQRFFEADRDVEGARLRKLVGVDSTTPLIGFVGFLVDQKRPERTVEVLAGVRKIGVRAHLVIAGDGPLRAELEQVVRALDLENDVTLLGHRNDVEHVFGGVDVALIDERRRGYSRRGYRGRHDGMSVCHIPAGRCQ